MGMTVSTKWHPDPEEKPTLSGPYIVTIEGSVSNYVETDISYLFHNGEDLGFMRCDDEGWSVVQNVVAWMTYPEPFYESEEEAFKKSIELARECGVPEDKILKNSDDIERFFMGG